MSGYLSQARPANSTYSATLTDDQVSRFAGTVSVALGEAVGLGLRRRWTVETLIRALGRVEATSDGDMEALRLEASGATAALMDHLEEMSEGPGDGSGMDNAVWTAFSGRKRDGNRVPAAKILSLTRVLSQQLQVLSGLAWRPHTSWSPAELMAALNDVGSDVSQPCRVRDEAKGVALALSFCYRAPEKDIRATREPAYHQSQDLRASPDRQVLGRVCRFCWRTSTDVRRRARILGTCHVHTAIIYEKKEENPEWWHDHRESRRAIERMDRILRTADEENIHWMFVGPSHAFEMPARQERAVPFPPAGIAGEAWAGWLSHHYPSTADWIGRNAPDGLSDPLASLAALEGRTLTVAEYIHYQDQAHWLAPLGRCEDWHVLIAATSVLGDAGREGGQSKPGRRQRIRPKPTTPPPCA